MSTRERWIVYPLLLLALGTALRPKFFAHVPQERVLCRELFVVDDEGNPRIGLFVHKRSENLTVGANELATEAEFRVIDRQGMTVARIRSDAASRAGLIETRTSSGQPQTALVSSDSGGEILAYDNDRRQTVGIGYRAGQSGLSLTDLNSRESLFVPIPKLLR
jgi:hypothetical protein